MPEHRQLAPPYLAPEPVPAGLPPLPQCQHRAAVACRGCSAGLWVTGGVAEGHEGAGGQEEGVRRGPGGWGGRWGWVGHSGCRQAGGAGVRRGPGGRGAEGSQWKGEGLSPTLNPKPNLSTPNPSAPNLSAPNLSAPNLSAPNPSALPP